MTGFWDDSGISWTIRNLKFASTLEPHVPPTRRVIVGDRAFAVSAAPRVWNHRHRIDKYLDTLLANQPISDGEATDRCKSLRRKMADCPS